MLVMVKHPPIIKFDFIGMFIPNQGNIMTCDNKAIKYPTITFVIDSNNEKLFD